VPTQGWKLRRSGEPIPYGDYHRLEAADGSIGIMTCLLCGAAVILDSDDGDKRHDAWHARYVVKEEAKDA
jgi:hypothetical protein